MFWKNACAVAVLVTAAGLAAMLGGCLNTTSDTPAKADPNQDPNAAAESSAALFLSPAYRLNRDASTEARLDNPPQSKEETGRTVVVPVTATTWTPSSKPKGYSGSTATSLGIALLKRSAGAVGLAKSSASGSAIGNASDTVWHYADSATGIIQRIVVTPFSDTTGSGVLRDSIIFRFPYLQLSPYVLGQVAIKSYAGGKTVTLTVTDEDGDPLLNEAPTGYPIKLHKKWITLHGDTTWRSDMHSLYGITTFYDSIGSGSPSQWTDSIFNKGVCIWWEKTYDCDGDGMVLTHAAGGKTKIQKDSYTDLGDGSVRMDFEAFGPGPDGDYMREADNERYPFRSVVFDAHGNEKVTTRFGDKDGDGFFWSPDAGAGNLASVVNVFQSTDSVKSRIDSLVETVPEAGSLPASGDLAAAKVVYFGSTLTYKDSTSSRIFTKAGKDGFSGSDTITIWEYRSYAKYQPSAADDPLKDIDSTLRVTWVVPNDLSNPDDDQIVKWYSESFFKSGHSKVTVTDVFTPDAPIRKSQAAQAGTGIHEEILHPLNSQSVIRALTWKAFDLSQHASNWKETRYFENGDSSIAMGNEISKGVGGYSHVLGAHLLNSGWFDANTGGFKDTLKVTDLAGKPLFTETCAGTLSQAGTGSFDRKRIMASGSAAGALADHFEVGKDGADGAGGFKLTMTGKDTAVISLRGDSATWAGAMPGTNLTLTWSHPGAGVYQVSESGADTKTKSITGTGDFKFGEDGTGKGLYTPYANGKAQPDQSILFSAEGGVFEGGVRIGP